MSISFQVLPAPFCTIWIFTRYANFDHTGNIGYVRRRLYEEGRRMNLQVIVKNVDQVEMHIQTPTTSTASTHSRLHHSDASSPSSALASRRLIRYAGELIPFPDVILSRLSAHATDDGLSVLRYFSSRAGGAVRVLNSARGVSIARDKFLTAQCCAAAGLPVPRVMLWRPPYDLDAAEQSFGYPCVVKLARGSCGKEVWKIDSRAQMEKLTAQFKQRLQQWKGRYGNSDKSQQPETQPQQQTAAAAATIPTASGGDPVPCPSEVLPSVLVQEWLGDSCGMDVRCLVVGGRVVAACMRTAAQGNFKSNFHQGGSGQTVTVDHTQTIHDERCDRCDSNEEEEEDNHCSCDRKGAQNKTEQRARLLLDPSQAAASPSPSSSPAGSGVVGVVSDSLVRLALLASRACRLDISGVDLLLDECGGYTVCEVNSTPGFEGVERTTGVNCARHMVEAVRDAWIRAETNKSGKKKEERGSGSPSRKQQPPANASTCPHAADSDASADSAAAAASVLPSAVASAAPPVAAPLFPLRPEHILLARSNRQLKLVPQA